MILEEIVGAANSLSDDQIPFDEVRSFVNDAIAQINVEAKAKFPFLDAPEDEPSFPETWQRMLLIPYAKGRIKEKDSSEFEWTAGYEQFFTNLTLFKSNYIVPDDLVDKETGSSISKKSIIDNEPIWYGGW